MTKNKRKKTLYLPIATQSLLPLNLDLLSDSKGDFTNEVKNNHLSYNEQILFLYE